MDKIQLFMNKVEDSKRVQLGILQTRIGLHGSRMWQMPLSYLGLVAVCLNALVSEKKVIPSFILFTPLTFLGMIMLWALYGAHRRYQETVNDANELETELGLRKYTRCDSYHTYPYYALMIFGIICCLWVSVFFKY